MSLAFNWFCALYERVEFTSNFNETAFLHFRNLACQTVFDMLEKNVLNPVYTDIQLDFIARFVKENESSIDKKYRFRWFCFKHCRAFFDFYTRYRTRRILKRRQQLKGSQAAN